MNVHERGKTEGVNLYIKYGKRVSLERTGKSSDSARAYGRGLSIRGTSHTLGSTVRNSSYRKKSYGIDRSGDEISIAWARMISDPRDTSTLDL